MKNFKFRVRPLLVLILCGMLYSFSLFTKAQNVTISPSSGHLIAALTYENEVGFENGWSALWRHNQLPLSLHVSDKPDLTASGVLKDPAGNIRLDTNRNLYVLMGGSSVTTHMSFSLPKGFRFTGYRMVLLNDMNGQSYGGFTLASISKRMYETNSSFSYSSPLASTAVMSGTNDSKEYVIERTSKTETDMGNNLYFYFWREKDDFYGATIKSIELYFTAEAVFQAEGVPGAPSEIISDGVNMVGSEFTTGKLDLGVVKPNTKSGVTYYSYDYQNVIDLTAKNWLYQEDAVTDGKLPETAGSGNIQVLRNDGQLYYALGNGTYYIETPTETKNQNGKTIPLGYRITGAQIKAHYGTAAGSSTVSFDSKTGTISYTSGWWGTTYYLQTNGRWDTSPQTMWTLTETNKLQSGNYYLTVQKYTSNGRTSYIANGTTNKDEASAFTISNNQVKYGDLYLSRYSNDRARFYSDNDYAATWTANQGSTTNPAYTPSDFTLTLYGTSARDFEEMAKVSSTNKDAQVSVSGLNNDAVKFTISGLKDGTKALITYNLTMEQLNPFINSLDIVCHSKKMEGQTISQQFTSNDFQVAGGEFLFYVPSDFVGDDNKCKFTFENLTSKYMDDTYGKGTTGNARNFLVKSAYYNAYGDGKQYTASGNEEATTKVSTEMCGDKPFTFNNAAQLEASGTAATASTLEEYPYSEDLYTKSQGGSFTSDIELAINQEKKCYLFAGDETRYNIAPTTGMEHRYYAYYLMDIKLLVKDYNAKCILTKLYNSTCYDGDQEKPMYGGVFKAYDKETGAEIPSQSAYLTVNMMKQALVKALEDKGATTDQVLYLDYTNLYSVLVESKENMAAMKKKLNPNCLIFFPERTFFDEDNYVQKTMSGGYMACKNIVITDKQPFYTPYKITVPAENYATYTRKITVPLNGKVALATIVLPFSLEMQDGVHTNATEDGCSFSLHQLKPSNCLAITDDEMQTAMNYHGKAGFDKIDLQHTIPNAPYLVKVENAPEDAQVSFIATQYGSDVLPTKGGDGETFMPMDETDYTFKGETGEGTIGSANYSFVNYGSYSGRKLDKNKGWFYFSGGMFLNSKNLADIHDFVYAYPFRAYFAYSCTDQSKLMTAMEVSFDDNTATGISIVGEDAGKGGLTITSGNSSLTLYAGRDASVVVASATGTLVGRYSMKQGDRKTLSLPSGLYVVNGNKVVVK